jgi:hypothetical protein
VRALSLFIGLCSAQALAFGSIEGFGRITAEAGYRWAPDPHFAAAAAAQGMQVVSAPGGAQAQVSFGYGATEWLEVSVDVFGAVDSFTLDGQAPYTSAVYGALAGVRLTQQDVFFQGFMPHLGLAVGPAFASVGSAASTTDSTQWAGSVNGGFTIRLNPRFGLTFDFRFLMARAYFPGVAGINVGGGFFSVGLTTLFAPQPKSDLSVPGF